MTSSGWNRPTRLLRNVSTYFNQALRGENIPLIRLGLLTGIQICNRHGVVDPVEFVEQWFAYSCSKLGGAEPTLDNLRDMESHEYANRSRKPAANPSLARVRHGEVAVVVSSSGSGGSRASASGLEAGDLSGRSGGGGGGGSGGLVIYSNAEENEVENEVLGSYGCHTPKVGGNENHFYERPSKKSLKINVSTTISTR